MGLSTLISYNFLMCLVATLSTSQSRNQLINVRKKTRLLSLAIGSHNLSCLGQLWVWNFIHLYKVLFVYFHSIAGRWHCATVKSKKVMTTLNMSSALSISSLFSKRLWLWLPYAICDIIIWCDLLLYLHLCSTWIQ